jgi:hypothetical protein
MTSATPEIIIMMPTTKTVATIAKTTQKVSEEANGESDERLQER